MIEPKISLEGSVLNSERTNSVVREMSIGIHVESRSKASLECLPKATNEFRIAIIDEHSR
jgi:hypothetical protein